MSARDDKPKAASGLQKKAATLGSILALIALVVGALFGDRGLLYLVAERERTELLRREIQDLRAHNGRLAEEIRALRTDPRAIERIARENLGLAREGEVVFLIRGAGEPASR